jgi:hypothetical protein
MIDALTRALLLKYDPTNPRLQEPLEGSPEAAVEQMVHTLAEVNKSATAALQDAGLPQFVIELIEKQRKINEAKTKENR